MAQISLFRGLFPAVDPVKIPNDAATVAENVDFRSGALRGYSRKVVVMEVAAATLSVTPDGTGWREHTAEVNHIQYLDRHIITGDGYPKYYEDGGTLRRLGFGSEAHYTVPPLTVVRTTGTGADGSIYQFLIELENSKGDVSEVSEIVESPLLSPTDRATITPATPQPNEGEEITLVNIYVFRGSDSPTLFKSLTLSALAPLTFTPNEHYPGARAINLFLTADTSGRTRTPRPGLKKIILHENGFFVGYDGSRLCMTDGLRVSVWPVEYEIEMNDLIDDIIEFRNDIYVFSNGKRPKVVRVNRPEFPEVFESDVNFYYRAGAARTNNGVFYMSDQGLVLLGQGLITRPHFEEKTTPAVISAVGYNDNYIAYTTEKSWRFDFRPVETPMQISNGENARYAVERDGKLYFIQGQVLYEDSIEDHPSYYRWVSKIMRHPKRINEEGIRIDHECRRMTETYYRGGIGVWTDPIGPIGTRTEQVQYVNEIECELRVLVEGRQESSEPWMEVFCSSNCSDEYGNADSIPQGEPLSMAADFEYRDVRITIEGRDAVTDVSTARTKKALEVIPGLRY